MGERNYEHVINLNDYRINHDDNGLGVCLGSDSVPKLMNQDKQKRLEEIYKTYPKKLGKSQGMKTARSQCKTEAKLNLLAFAVENYIKHIHDNGTHPQFIMYFSTFMNQWQDWTDPDQGKVTMAVKCVGPELDPEIFE